MKSDKNLILLADVVEKLSLGNDHTETGLGQQDQIVTALNKGPRPGTISGGLV